MQSLPDMWSRTTAATCMRTIRSERVHLLLCFPQMNSCATKSSKVTLKSALMRRNRRKLEHVGDSACSEKLSELGTLIIHSFIHLFIYLFSKASLVYFKGTDSECNISYKGHDEKKTQICSCTNLRRRKIKRRTLKRKVWPLSAGCSIWILSFKGFGALLQYILSQHQSVSPPQNNTCCHFC